MALTPSDIKRLCAEYGLLPSKAYGQNYLIHDAPIEAMIKAAEIQPGDTVIEVGPGFGVLTLALAKIAKEVTAFEIEKTLEGYWNDQIKKYPNVHVVWGNVLTSSQTHPFPQDRPYKVVANVPYHITSELIRLFVETDPAPTHIVVMVQKEVAERLVAKPGEMSLLSLGVQYYGEVKKVMNVSKGSFWPSPKVDSAVVSIVLQPKKKSEAELFFLVARAGFSHKRKKLVNNVAGGLHVSAEVVESILQSLGIRPDVRAESLSVLEWTKIAHELSSYLSTQKPK